MKHLTDIYFQSVGYNSVLLLNIPPDKRGLIHEADVNRLKEFRQYLDRVFSDNRILEGDKLWKVSPGEQREYLFKQDSRVNVILLQEDITKGQRVESTQIEVWKDGRWEVVAEGATVGYKRIFRIPEVNASKLRVTVTGSRGKAYISRVAAYYAQPLADESEGQEWNNLSRDSWKQVSAKPLVIDLGKSVSLEAFTYAPAGAEAKPDMAFRYTFSVSMDGVSWQTVLENQEFSNIMNNPIPQTVRLGQKVETRYSKLEAVSVEGMTSSVMMSEIGITVSK